MTSDDTKYSHIAVSSDDEDEVVIRAGIRDDAGERPAVSGRADDHVGEGGPAVRSEDGATGAPARKDATAKGGSGHGSQPADQPQETTEADLRQTSMPMMQKVIIVLAVIAIVAFVVYYNFLR